MKIVITQAKRLDEIVFEHYKSLEFFDEVLLDNQHILHKVILEVGDEIVLNEFYTKTSDKNINALWD